MARARGGTARARTRAGARALALGLAATAGVSAAAREAGANPVGMYGFGSRSAAMAGGVSADADDFSANYYNPAGLLRAPSMRLDVGYFYAHHALAANGRESGVDPARGVVVGLAAPGRAFDVPFAFGFALHVPDDRISRSRALPQGQPRWELYDNRVQLIFIAANLAFAPRPWLRVGGGLSFVSSTRGRLDIYGDITFPNASDSRLMHAVDADLVAVRYPQVGVQVDVRPDLTFSAVYRGEFALRLELDALVAGTVVVGMRNDPRATRVPGTYALRSASTAVFLPQQAVLGAAWRPVPWLTLVADVTWIDWSSYQNPSARLRATPDIRIPPGLPISAPMTPPAVEVVPASFADTFVPRVGVEGRRTLGPHVLALRAGYRYDASPVPDQRGATNFMDSTRHVVSAGVGLSVGGLAPVIGGALSLDVHGDVQVLERRVVTKDDPADPVGDYVLTGAVYQLGATASVRF